MLKMRTGIIILLILITLGCKNNRNTVSQNDRLELVPEPDKNLREEYLRWVGDIEHDENIDHPNFKVCHGDDNILQYFNLGKGPNYKGGKPSIVNTFKSKYKFSQDSSQNGFIRIRFIVNCEGKSGRFRLLQSNYNYEPFEFDKKITSQLLDITKSIEDWKIFYRKDTPVDYYLYLIFKIKNGQLTEILP